MFTEYDNNYVPPMPAWLLALWTPIFSGSWDEPPIPAPVWNIDEEWYL